MQNKDLIIDRRDAILVTGAGGFVGSRVIDALIRYGFENIRCFLRPSSKRAALEILKEESPDVRLDFIEGNLLNRDDCRLATDGVAVIYHLAAGVDKSFPSAFMNSVVTTRNLLDTVIGKNHFKRFVNVGTIAAYSNATLKRGALLDERCEIHAPADRLDEAYVYGKIKQDEIVVEYHDKHSLPFVLIRPAVVFGPGKTFFPSRVGMDTFGFFMHLGGSNLQPMTYVDNCADAIVRAGVMSGCDGETFIIVDDELPTSRQFLQLYRKRVKRFPSLYIPYPVFYGFSYLWERYSQWSRGQLPPVFTTARAATYYKGNRYSNQKLKAQLQWKPRVGFREALERYFEYQIEAGAQR